jgi:hypothetical protein
MKTLQEILDDVNKTKFGKLSDGKIQMMMTGMSQTNRLLCDKEKLKTRGKRLGSTVGKFNMTDYTREMSKVPTMCPNCLTVGPLCNMRQHHMDKCKRVKDYSDSLIIENYKKGISVYQISKDSGVSYSQTKLIIRNYKKNITS